MKRNRGYKFCFGALLVFIILTVGAVLKSTAANTGFSVNAGEVVFLLDTSESMNIHDEDRLSIDAVRQTIYSLPSEYKKGLVAYGTDIQTEIPFDVKTDQWESRLEGLSFSGYTNAGEGLKRALNLFSNEENVDRYIIMLTDGEVDMPDEKNIENSFRLYEETSQMAKERGVKICIVAIGSDLNSEKTQIFNSAEVTGGIIYRVGQSATISETINRILFEYMKFPRSSLGVTSGKGGSISAELPSTGAENVKIILSGQGLENITADYTARSGEILSGQDFAVIDITRPSGEAVKITFETYETASVEAYMIIEYEAELQAEADYRIIKNESEPKTGSIRNQEITYTHFADIAISLVDSNGKNNSIWNSPYYEGTKVTLRINGEPVSGIIHNGEISYSMQIDGLKEVEIEVETESFSEQFRDLEPVNILFSPPPEPVENPDYKLIWIILGVLFLLIFGILLIRLKAKNSTIIYMEPSATGKETERRSGVKTNSYTGKLNLYVIQTRSGEDIAPQTYRLFGRQSAKITLNQILSFCGIRFGKIGAEDIAFYPGYDKSLVVMDQSEKCTVMRGTEILKKGMGYPIYYNGKITVTFEDGITEIELYYKNLKPNEYEYENRNKAK